MKEFIPGIRLRTKMERQRERIESISLKKQCIDGSILYTMYKRLNMRAEMKCTSDDSLIIYQIFFKDIEGLLPAQDNKDLMFYPIKNELEEVILVVMDGTKEVRKVIISTRTIGEKKAYEYTSVDAVIKQLKNVSGDIDWEKARVKLADFKMTDGDGEMAFIIALPAGNEEGYGFYVRFVKKIFREGRELYRMTDGKYYNYEPSGSDFFNGLR